MAFDAFIEIGKIEGESTDSRHAGWIEILDCNMGILQSVSKPASTAGGAASGRAEFSDFRFTKLLDKSSPELALACRQIYADAVKQFGEKVVVSKKSGHLRQVTQFIRTHPNYPQLMLQPKALPEHLLPGPRHKLVPPSNTRVPSHTARHFRKQYFQAFQNQSSGRYMGTIGSQLKGRISTLKSVGRGATWYIPAVLSLHSVYTAPPELRMRTLFAEGFGVVGGGFGSMAGTFAGIGIVTILGLGPLGLFVAVLICATVGGIALFEAIIHTIALYIFRFIWPEHFG
jgi:hypothetical protein